MNDSHRFHIYEDSGQWPHVSCNDCSWSQALPSFDPTLEDIIDAWDKRPCNQKDIPEIGSMYLTETGNFVTVIERIADTVWFSYSRKSFTPPLMSLPKSVFLQNLKKVG